MYRHKTHRPLTVTIFTSLTAGKILFVTSIVLAASKCGVAPLSYVMRASDITMISAMASIGLTVSLFIAGEAFQKHETLQAEAKMGAILSGLVGIVCVFVSRTPLWNPLSMDATEPDDPLPRPSECSASVEEEEEDVDDVAFIVAAALKKQYLLTKSRVIAHERKAILRGGSSASFASPKSTSRP